MTETATTSRPTLHKVSPPKIDESSDYVVQTSTTYQRRPFETALGFVMQDPAELFDAIERTRNLGETTVRSGLNTARKALGELSYQAHMLRLLGHELGVRAITSILN